MQEFSRIRAELVKGVLYSLGGALVAFVPGAVLGWPLWARAALCLGALLGLAALFVLGDALCLRVYPNGRFTCHRLGRLRADVMLGECRITLSSRPRGSLGYTDMTLFLTPPGGKRLRIDCAPLGKPQFDRLCAALRQHTSPN